MKTTPHPAISPRRLPSWDTTRALPTPLVDSERPRTPMAVPRRADRPPPAPGAAGVTGRGVGASVRSRGDISDSMCDLGLPQVRTADANSGGRLLAKSQRSDEEHSTCSPHRRRAGAPSKPKNQKRFFQGCGAGSITRRTHVVCSALVKRGRCRHA